MKKPKTFTAYFSRNRKPIKAGLPGGKLYCVIGHDGNHYPLTCYVRAASPEDAIERIRIAAEMVARGNNLDARRLANFLPGLKFTAEECPEEIVLCGGSCWAGNSGFQGRTLQTSWTKKQSTGLCAR
jgi:hypothetical protein